MRQVLLEADELIGHNIILWDIPHIERLLKIKIEGRLIDTLALSWYLYPNRNRHGLEYWGVELGIEKPVIEDWENQSIADYIFRCESDVEINKRLWNKQNNYLYKLYDDPSVKERLIRYLSFKLSCVELQEKSRWKLNVKLAEEHLKELEEKKEPIIEGLKGVMPMVPTTTTIKVPQSIYLANGEIGVRGKKWLDIQANCVITESNEETLTYIKGYEEPNPNSHIQVKEWLFSLGWKPISFKYEVNKDTGEKREIPQVKVDSELCISVEDLIEKQPQVEFLRNLTVISHRINLLKGFLRDQKNGYLVATIGGLTNTLRFKHSQIVNLPGVHRDYGKYVRGVLIAENGYELCGSDMASLEDRTKQHYMWEYDPEYVKEMQVEDFDPHLSLAEFAGALTPEQVQAHKDKKEDYSVVRHLYKTANYACIYGVGAFKLSKTLDITQAEAKAIIKAYWEKNWSVKQVADDQKVRTIGKQMWILNPVSNFWYSLRYEKDKFSTLNQGTGVYCFDTWIKYFLQVRRQLTGQMHDEVILHVKKGNRERCTDMLNTAIRQANNELKLNRELGIDIQYGDSYADIH